MWLGAVAASSLQPVSMPSKQLMQLCSALLCKIGWSCIRVPFRPLHINDLHLFLTLFTASACAQARQGAAEFSMTCPSSPELYTQ